MNLNGEKACQSIGIFEHSIVRIFSKNGRWTNCTWLAGGRTSNGGVCGSTMGWCRAAAAADDGVVDETWSERDERERVVFIWWILFANWGVKLVLMRILQRWSRSRLFPWRVTFA